MTDTDLSRSSLMALVPPGHSITRREGAYAELFETSASFPADADYAIVELTLGGERLLERPPAGYTAIGYRGLPSVTRWLLRRLTVGAATPLDLFTAEHIRQCEWIFGAGQVNVGGQAMYERLLDLVEPKVGDHVLDLGAGLGGIHPALHRRFGVQVWGVDSSASMFAEAVARDLRRPSGTIYSLGDVNECRFPAGRFDRVLSRETLLYIHDKRRALSRLLSWMRPGATLLLSDYSRGEHVSADSPLWAYMKRKGYDLRPPGWYESTLSEVGFTDIVVRDRSTDFRRAVERELDQLRLGSAAFTRSFGADAHQKFARDWSQKLDRIRAGDQRWVVVTARRPD